MTYTLGSLFDGIGGFPLAGSRNGFTPVWASEIEAAPIAVTKRHFPDMPHLGDITRIHGGEIPPVDVITFGSPCQDLSVAGPRAGIDGARSGLFREAVRIIKEMREATNGSHPTFAVWENVPGAFSSPGKDASGEDFRVVLEELAGIAEPGISIPRPSGKKGKWRTAGSVMGNGWSLAWRVLDAQYWGVPQRRRRIFLVADFAAGRAREVLFKPEGLRGHTPPGGQAREGTAADTQGSVSASGFNGWRSVTGSIEYEDGRAPCLTAKMAPNVIHPAVSGTLLASGAGLDRTAGIVSETDLCVAYPWIARTLTARHDSSPCVDRGQNTVCYPAQAATPYTYKSLGEYAEDRIGKTLMSGVDITTGDLIVQRYIVRRLTPTECERLQGFPDGWTEYGADVKPLSDSARYSALGNSLAIPCVEYVLAGVREALEGEL